MMDDICESLKNALKDCNISEVTFRKVYNEIQNPYYGGTGSDAHSSGEEQLTSLEEDIEDARKDSIAIETEVVAFYEKARHLKSDIEKFKVEKKETNKHVKA